MIASVFATTSSASGDWPVVRGDSASSGVAAIDLPDEPAVLWQYTAEGSAFDATPVIAGGVVYAGDADGTVHAVGLADGVRVWTKSFDESGFAAAGAVVGDTLVVGDAYGVVRSLATADGAVRWEVATESEVFAGPMVYAAAEGAQTALVTTESGELLALDAADGAERWRFAIDQPLRCTATVVAGHALLAGCDGKLHAIDLETGAESGSIDIGGPTGSTAAVHDGVAYFGAESGSFYAIDARDPRAMKTLWTHRDARRAQGVRSAAAASAEGVVYGSFGKAFYCLDPKDGAPRWQKPDRARVESSPLVVATPGRPSRALLATGRGVVLLVALESGDTLWEHDAGGSFVASPAAADGRVVVANTDGALTCFGTDGEGTTDERR
ncbi:MAG: PQQ-binding-like beta-propeller repeat protein [Lacipirellulaceae bacterium]